MLSPTKVFVQNKKSLLHWILPCCATVRETHNKSTVAGPAGPLVYLHGQQQYEKSGFYSCKEETLFKIGETERALCKAGIICFGPSLTLGDLPSFWQTLMMSQWRNPMLKERMLLSLLSFQSFHIFYLFIGSLTFGQYMYTILHHLGKCERSQFWFERATLCTDKLTLDWDISCLLIIKHSEILLIKISTQNLEVFCLFFFRVEMAPREFSMVSFPSASVI